MVWILHYNIYDRVMVFNRLNDVLNYLSIKKEDLQESEHHKNYYWLQEMAIYKVKVTA
jgi:hypothetical protein